MPRQTEYDFSATEAHSASHTAQNTAQMRTPSAQRRNTEQIRRTDTAPVDRAHTRTTASMTSAGRTSASMTSAGRTSASMTSANRAAKAPSANTGTAQRSAYTKSAVRTPPRRRRKRRDLRRSLKKLGAWAAIIGTSSVILSAIIMSILVLSVHGFFAKRGSFTYQIGTDSDVYLSRQLKYESAYRNGVMYFNLSELADYCDLVVTGTVREIRFLSHAAQDDNARMIIGTPLAYINNIPVRLEAPFLLEDDQVFVPESFVKYYMNGLTVQTDEDGKVTVAREVEREEPPTVSIRGETEAVVVYRTVGFALHETVVPEHIAESDVDRLIPLPEVPQQ